MSEALLLIGSAKQTPSTSGSLGHYLVERLNERGFHSTEIFLHRSLWTQARRDELLAATDRADLLVLAFPLFVDCLPYIVIRACEDIAEHRRAHPTSHVQRLAVIVNCGFPEAAHCAVALEICRQFASEVSLEWSGGLALGAGETFSGRPLQEFGAMARHILDALDDSATALAGNEPIPPQAVEQFARLLVPVDAYILYGGEGWKRSAKRFQMQDHLDAKPYMDQFTRSK